MIGVAWCKHCNKPQRVEFFNKGAWWTCQVCQQNTTQREMKRR